MTVLASLWYFSETLQENTAVKLVCFFPLPAYYLPCITYLSYVMFMYTLNKEYVYAGI